MSDPALIFDRNRVKAHRDRAARHVDDPCDFLLAEMADRLCERLLDINRTFPLALDLGAHHGVLAQNIPARAGVETLVQADLSQALIMQAGGEQPRLVADEELLPFAENSFDLVMSCGSLHWVNDLPGVLVQIRHILKPDGLFLAMLPGGRTLQELRGAFEQAEMAASGGVSPRVSPFIDVRDAGSLLQRAGFALPVVDSELLSVSYEHPLKLLKELRAMGESNALVHSRKGMTGCSVMMMAMDQYLRDHMDEQQRVPATFELVTLTAWKPHASQQQPAARGSGQVNLGEALK